MRKFGLVLGLVFLVFAMLIWFKHRHESPAITPSAYLFMSVAAVSVIFAFLHPKSLKPVNTVSVFIAMVIGWLMTRVILAVTFYAVFTPIGLTMRLFGKDSMDRKFNSNSETYWKKRSDEPYNPERSRRLF